MLLPILDFRPVAGWDVFSGHWTRRDEFLQTKPALSGTTGWTKLERQVISSLSNRNLDGNRSLELNQSNKSQQATNLGSKQD